MDFPDLSGYGLESHIYSAARLVVLWFSKVDRQLELWRQIQVTLVNARPEVPLLRADRRRATRALARSRDR